MSLNENAPLSFDKVDKAFGAHTVLSDFSFELRPLEKVAFIGPSGSGKTTVPRSTMALERPTNGKITVFGRDYWPSNLSPRASHGHLRTTFSAAAYNLVRLPKLLAAPT